MSDYKIIKNSLGELVNYGPNTESYQPIVNSDETLTIEPAEIAEPLIKDFVNKQDLEVKNAVAAAEAKLIALGLTTDDIKALGLGGN
jgi:hypothetical protein